MGATGSKLEKALGDQFPEGERYFGLENFGKTCYCNSVLQALYFCVPFREQLLKYYETGKNPVDLEENLLTCLAELFMQRKKHQKSRWKIYHLLKRSLMGHMVVRSMGKKEPLVTWVHKNFQFAGSTKKDEDKETAQYISYTFEAF